MVFTREILQAGDVVLMQATVVTAERGRMTIKTRAGDQAKISIEEIEDVVERALAPGERVFYEKDPERRPATVLGTDRHWAWIRWDESDYMVYPSASLVRSSAKR